MTLRSVQRFNEAAGVPRGIRPPPPTGAPARAPASMRPREFPAESMTTPARGAWRRGGFNEAAGVPRGIHGAPRAQHAWRQSFNEAAGVPRGILNTWNSYMQSLLTLQ